MTFMNDAEANLVEDTFYGFALGKNGALTVNMIDDASTVITTEDSYGTIDDSAYKHNVWSKYYLTFSFGDRGHLLVKIV